MWGGVGCEVGNVGVLSGMRITVGNKLRLSGDSVRRDEVAVSAVMKHTEGKKTQMCEL